MFDWMSDLIGMLAIVLLVCPLTTPQARLSPDKENQGRLEDEISAYPCVPLFRAQGRSNWRALEAQSGCLRIY
jgi:hypothetical protein